MRLTSLIAFVALAACTAADVPTPEPLVKASSDVWTWGGNVAALREQSCPKDAGFLKAQSIEIKIIEAERGSERARERNLSGVTLAGAWQLKSDEPNFGGLSGLDVMRSGSLLVVNDDGAFFWIGIDPVTGSPDGIGAIAYMRDANGDYFDSKLAADSEGLSLRDGVALVSFERDHRIEAFDLESCGAAARAARVVQFDDVVDRQLIDSNRGPEALALSGDTLLAGFETHRSGGSPIAQVLASGAVVLKTYTEQPGLYLLTGMDKAYGLAARTFRAYDPVRGARVILQVDGPDGRLAEAHLKRPLPVDNFEGVAIGRSPDGAPRIWVISDNNFSRDQRTLLLALDLADAPQANQ